MRQLVHSITRKDLVIDWFSGSGAGGQHRNKHSNCVRLTHRPTGLVSVGQDHKERHRNMRDALRRLAERLESWIREQVARPVEAPKSDEVVRTYHFAEDRFVDHASGKRWTGRDFDLDEAIRSRLAAKSRS